MSVHALRLAVAAAGSALILVASSTAAQVPGIDAYRSAPRPGAAQLYSPNPVGPAHSPFARRGTLTERAQAEVAAGNFRAANRMLARRAPMSTDPQLLYLSAVSHAGLGELDEARRQFARGLAADEDHVGARVGLALTDIRLGRYNEAAAALAVIEAQRASCNQACGNARDLDRAMQMIRHFLPDQPA